MFKEVFAMSEKRRQFDKAYKLSAVRLLEQSGKPLELVARGLGISGSMLRRWRDQVRLKGAESFSEAGRQDRQTSSSAAIEQFRLFSLQTMTSADHKTGYSYQSCI